jgi:FAD synthetase
MSTASVIVIGNEILSGKFTDENTPFLIRRLRELGITLSRAVVIPDDIKEIAREVELANDRYDRVFTTGGVGPTHDDMTMLGVASAFGVKLVEQKQIVDLMEDRLGTLTPAARRMALVPEGSRLLWDGELWFPLVVMDKVHIFPGVPSLMRRKFEALARGWAALDLFTARVTTGSRETEIAAILEDAVARWPAVEVGSYPRYDDGPHHVIVTLEGRDAGAVEACRAWLAERLPPYAPPSSLPDDPEE